VCVFGFYREEPEGLHAPCCHQQEDLHPQVLRRQRRRCCRRGVNHRIVKKGICFGFLFLSLPPMPSTVRGFANRTIKNIKNLEGLKCLLWFWGCEGVCADKGTIRKICILHICCLQHCMTCFLRLLFICSLISPPSSSSNLA